MKLRFRNSRTRAIGPLLVLVGVVSAMGTGALPVGAQVPASAPLAITLVQATPPPPSGSASTSQWSQYASLWNGALQGGVKSVTWDGSACPVVSFQALAVPSSLAQAAGDGSSAIDGFSMALRCPIGSAGAGSA